MNRKQKVDKEETQDTQIIFRIRTDDKNAFKAIAKSKHFTMVNYLRRLIVKEILLDEIKKQKAEQQKQNDSTDNSSLSNE